VCREHRVVRFDNGSRNLRRGGDCKRKLGLATIVHRKTFQQKRTKTGSSTSSGSVEDKETLKSTTVISELADTVQDSIDNFLSNGVVTPGVVVGRILLSVDDLIRMVELGVGAAADFVTYCGFEINVDSTGNVLSRLSLAEKGIERVISDAYTLVRCHRTIGLNAVLKAIKFPALVTDLDTGLTQVDGDTFYII
jgi:hypothetical protein